MTTPHQSFLGEFNDARKPLVEAMLTAIHEACPDLTESIKWNAPNFSDAGKDRLSFMLHKPDRVVLVLHAGAKVKEDKKASHLYQDDTGLLAWQSNIRATITFHDLAGFTSHRDEFKQAMQRWIMETAVL
ncbi:MAG: DUF1801 domain-containing protein [Anaerolineales bacterium]|nr:DUF1801 domain-containing protein [Anaerolineales bacterium]